MIATELAAFAAVAAAGIAGYVGYLVGAQRKPAAQFPIDIMVRVKAGERR